MHIPLSHPERSSLTLITVCRWFLSPMQCAHDVESPNNIPSPPQTQLEATHLRKEKEFDFYYEMVSNVPVLPNEEVFNTYGETLTNAQLLAQYGFVLDVNENDRLNWDLKEVYTHCTGLSGVCTWSLPELENIWLAILSRAAVCEALGSIAESNLVYLHTDTSGKTLCLDGDGKISHQLWTLLALPFCLQRIPGNVAEHLGEITNDLEALLEFQLALENSLEAGNDPGDSHRHKSSTKHAAMLAGLAHSLINLCVARKSQLGKKNPDCGDVNDILDVGICFYIAETSF
ncbi:hypothetical protein D9615_009138 [Tricholomella constricta]|uniref:Uncharacterized protein n=1 Tax=Tricholomella constricta TaxID=117010 RepID=A0A8H5LZX5_9AGAR|nr:hypothetical protein D9615_009138 [Tricholomella constricta]